MNGTRFEPMLAHECWELIRTAEVGRLGVFTEHYPLILPVNFGLDGDVVVVRTAPGPLLWAADHSNVCFQVDMIDVDTRSGWTVLIRGLAERVGDGHQPAVVERTQQQAAVPWAPGDREEMLRIIPHRVEGRRIVPQEQPQSGEAAAYL